MENNGRPTVIEAALWFVGFNLQLTSVSRLTAHLPPLTPSIYLGGRIFRRPSLASVYPGNSRSARS